MLTVVLSLRSIKKLLCQFERSREPLRLLDYARGDSNKTTMTKEELIAKLKTIVQPYIQDEEAFKNLNEHTDFINDLKINSANLVDVILDVEDEFDIRIENDDMEKMISVKAAMEIVNEKLAAK